MQQLRHHVHHLNPPSKGGRKLAIHVKRRPIVTWYWSYDKHAKVLSGRALLWDMMV